MLLCAMRRETASPAIVDPLAFPATAVEAPASLVLLPTMRPPMIAAALAHPVAVHPLVASASPFPVAGSPDVTDPGRRNDFDSGWGRCDINVDIHSGIACGGYCELEADERRNKNSGSYRHLILPWSVEFPVDASIGDRTGQ